MFWRLGGKASDGDAANFSWTGPSGIHPGTGVPRSGVSVGFASITRQYVKLSSGKEWGTQSDIFHSDGNNAVRSFVIYNHGFSRAMRATKTLLYIPVGKRKETKKIPRYP